MLLVKDAEWWSTKCSERMTVSDEGWTDVGRNKFSSLVQHCIDEGHLWTLVGVHLKWGQQLCGKQMLVVIEIHLNYNYSKSGITNTTYFIA